MSGEMTRKKIQEKLRLKDEKHFREAYQKPAIASGVFEMTFLYRSSSPLQNYRITPKGDIFLKGEI